MESLPYLRTMVMSGVDDGNRNITIEVDVSMTGELWTCLCNLNQKVKVAPPGHPDRFPIQSFSCVPSWIFSSCFCVFPLVLGMYMALPILPGDTVMAPVVEN